LVLVYASGIVTAGAWVFEQVKAHDFEGMFATRRDSTYQHGRSRDWLKIRNPDYSRPRGFGRRLRP
jgi:bifunctional non-homologous end joining protein LigD